MMVVTASCHYLHLITFYIKNVCGFYILSLFISKTSAVFTFYHFLYQKRMRFLHFITFYIKNECGFYILSLFISKTSAVSTFYHFLYQKRVRFLHFITFYIKNESGFIHLNLIKLIISSTQDLCQKRYQLYVACATCHVYYIPRVLPDTCAT